MITKIFVIVWPFIVTAFALFYHKKQNGSKPLTGGPISTPKSFWLAYTVCTWFFFPIILAFNPEVTSGLKSILIFHLISWWVRGILELIMIYKWFNWSPRYGISHDLFHLVALTILSYIHRLEFQALTPVNTIVSVFIIVIFFATIAEISFAYLFFKVRSKEEEEDNIYFASDDPKWIFINRLTLTIVCMVMIHLVVQSFYAFFRL